MIPCELGICSTFNLIDDMKKNLLVCSLVAMLVACGDEHRPVQVVQPAPVVIQQPAPVQSQPVIVNNNSGGEAAALAAGMALGMAANRPSYQTQPTIVNKTVIVKQYQTAPTAPAITPQAYAAPANIKPAIPSPGMNNLPKSDRNYKSLFDNKSAAPATQTTANKLSLAKPSEPAKSSFNGFTVKKQATK